MDFFIPESGVAASGDGTLALLVVPVANPVFGSELLSVLLVVAESLLGAALLLSPHATANKVVKAIRFIVMIFFINFDCLNVSSNNRANLDLYM
jgi:hypothetical protein